MDLLCLSGGRRLQLIGFGTVHLLLHSPEDKGEGKGHYQVHAHGNGEYLKVDIVGAGHGLGLEEQLYSSYAAEHAGILYVYDQVVAYLGHYISERLGHYHVKHGLEVSHAYGLGSLRLTGGNGNHAASEVFRHVSARVDGNNEEGRRPHAHLKADHHHGAVVYEHRLNHHGRSAEYFHVYPQDDLYNSENYFFENIVVGIYGNSLDDADYETDKASEKRSYNSYDQGGPCTLEQRFAIILKYEYDPGKEPVRQ